MKRIVIILAFNLLLLAFLLLVAEFALRFIIHRKYAGVKLPVQFIYPPDSVNGLKSSHFTYARPDSCFRVLCIGGSSSVWADYTAHITDAFLRVPWIEKRGYKVEVYSTGIPGHTTLDSYFKYKYIYANYDFDLILINHGMNDLKTNNCPPNVFRNNYTHIGLYTDLWKLFNNSDHPLIKHSYLTMALIKAGLDAKTNLQKLFKKGVERRMSQFNPHRRDWEIYGTDIKSAAPFRQNLENILRLAKSRHQKVLLVSFPYRIPDDYSLEKFRTGSLGYALDHTGLAKPLEVWGNRESIQKGILVHNQIILELAQKYACFYIDQHNLLQSDARYFIDPCHFSDAGISQFEENIYRFFYDKDLLASPN